MSSHSAQTMARSISRILLIVTLAVVPYRPCRGGVHFAHPTDEIGWKFGISARTHHYPPPVVGGGYYGIPFEAASYEYGLDSYEEEYDEEAPSVIGVVFHHISRQDGGFPVDSTVADKGSFGKSCATDAECDEGRLEVCDTKASRCRVCFPRQLCGKRRGENCGSDFHCSGEPGLVCRLWTCVCRDDSRGTLSGRRPQQGHANAGCATKTYIPSNNSGGSDQGDKEMGSDGDQGKRTTKRAERTTPSPATDEANRQPGSSTPADKQSRPSTTTEPSTRRPGSTLPAAPTVTPLTTSEATTTTATTATTLSSTISVRGSTEVTQTSTTGTAVEPTEGARGTTTNATVAPVTSRSPPSEEFYPSRNATEGEQESTTLAEIDLRGITRTSPALSQPTEHPQIFVEKTNAGPDVEMLPTSTPSEPEFEFEFEFPTATKRSEGPPSATPENLPRNVTAVDDPETSRGDDAQSRNDNPNVNFVDLGAIDSNSRILPESDGLRGRGTEKPLTTAGGEPQSSSAAATSVTEVLTPASPPAGPKTATTEPSFGRDGQGTGAPSPDSETSVAGGGETSPGQSPDRRQNVTSDPITSFPSDALNEVKRR